MIRDGNNVSYIVASVKAYNVKESNLYRSGYDLVLKGYNDDDVDYSEATPIRIALVVEAFFEIGDKFLVKHFVSKSSPGRYITDTVKNVIGGFIHGENTTNTFRTNWCKKVIVDHEQLSDSFLIDLINDNIRINRNVLVRPNRFDLSEPHIENGHIEYEPYVETWHDVIDNLRFKTKFLLRDEFDVATFKDITGALRIEYGIPQDIKRSVKDDWSYISNFLEENVVDSSNTTYQCMMVVFKKYYLAPVRKGVTTI